MQCDQHEKMNLATAVKAEEESDVDDAFEEEILDDCDVKEESDVPVTVKDEPLDLWPDLPKNLRLGPSAVKNEFGVFALENIERNVAFGPFKGLTKKYEENTGKFSWEMQDGILVTDENNSCYMRHVKNVATEKDQNLFVYQDDDEIYFKTTRKISKGEELFVRYEKKIPIVIKSHQENQTTYRCEFCDLTLGNLNNKRGHQRTCKWRFTKEEEESRDFQCQHCKTIITDEAYYKAHVVRCSHRVVKSKIPKNPAYMQCADCEYRTWRRPDLERHAFRKHGKGGGMPLFRCPHCEYSSPRRNTLNRHLNTHARARLFKCAYCARRASTVRNLHNHVLNSHREENAAKGLVPIRSKVHACAACGYVTVQLGHFKEHVRACRASARPHACDRCEYAAASGQNLAKHRRTHAAAGGYVCDRCGYRSVQKKTLENHLLNAHPGVDHGKLITHKVHRCGECTFASVVLSNFKRHVDAVHKK